MADVLSNGRSSMIDVIVPTEIAGIDVAPAHIDLASTEGELFTALGREQILREAFEGQIDGLRLRARSIAHRIWACSRSTDWSPRPA